MTHIRARLSLDLCDDCFEALAPHVKHLEATTARLEASPDRLKEVYQMIRADMLQDGPARPSPHTPTNQSCNTQTRTRTNVCLVAL